MTSRLPAALSLTILSLLALRPLHGQSDEIQVYTGEVAAPGTASITVHANYTPNGRAAAEIPGGVIPDGAVNGAFEWAYGVTNWLEAGAYLPVYSITRSGQALLDGVKLRALFAVPHAESRRFFYAVNFELSFNSKVWDEFRYGGEIRPIVGTRFSRWDFILNPILDTEFDGFSRLVFAPSARVAFNPSSRVALAVEHYADFGELRHFVPGEQREHSLFCVVDLAGRLLDIEGGVGFGLTKASDKLVLKTIVAHTF